MIFTVPFLAPLSLPEEITYDGARLANSKAMNSKSCSLGFHFETFLILSESVLPCGIDGN